MVSFVFIFLLPELYSIKSFEFYILALAGFSFFYVTEKLFYKHIIKTENYLEKTHFLINFLHQFMMGAFLYSLTKEKLIDGLFLFIPTVGIVLVGSLSIENIHKKLLNKLEIIVISISAVLGAIFASLVHNNIVNNILIAVVTGSLIFIVMRELIPFKKRGSPDYFLIGILLFLLMYGFLG